MSEKASFAFFETPRGASIHRIPLEAFPGFWAYVYVAQKGEYCALIDAGSGTEKSHEDLSSGLQRVGIEPSDLTHIFLTHAHIDHYGGLTKLRPLTSAKLAVHDLDLQTVAYHEARLALLGSRLDSFLAGAGLNKEACEQLLSIYRLPKSLFQSVLVDCTYEALGMQAGPFTFIHLPGHSPGHVAIRLDDVVFCGDLVVEGVTPHLSPESISPYSGLDHYLESLARLEAWSRGARLVFNGHDEALTDLAGSIESTRQNILRRLSRAVEALGNPLTVHELCRAVYGEMNGYNQLLVIEKAGAYVEYLYEHGMIGITNPEELEQGLPARYLRLREESLILTELGKGIHRYKGIQVET
jgi:glyoxylase-like metal-dependent hydrolase (beta-lactamase superfamily II)